jgi:DNA-binding Xre family transcriptional regulator
MSNTKQKEIPVPITVHLLPSTLKKLEHISIYLSIRHNQEKSIERIIKAAIANYLDVMVPIPEQDKQYIQTLIVDGPKYAIKNRFKEIMKQKGIKAVQIHRDTGISESNLSQLLNNKNLNMTLDSFLRIWIALDCPPIADCLYREDLDPK